MTKLSVPKLAESKEYETKKHIFIFWILYVEKQMEK